MIDTRLAILLWIPVTTFLFAAMRPLRAVTAAYLIGWLLLPIAAVDLPGFPDVDKVVATNAGILIGALLFQPRSLRRFRPHPADLVLLVFCGSFLVASLTNGLGIYDGVSGFIHRFMTYGVPYLAGRIFLRNRDNLYEAAGIIVFASAVYALFAVWEWRMSPQLHRTFYGEFQHSWGQHVRWGFYRPILFFQHALGLGTFFVWTSLLGLWLWRAGRLRAPWGLPSWTLPVASLLGLLTSMSMGPWMMFLAGLLMLWAWSTWRISWIAYVPIIFAAAWMGPRYTGMDDGQWLVRQIERISTERAASLKYRVDAENVLVGHAKARPFFGWGGWGRNRAIAPDGSQPATDGMWVIIVGTSGLVGLCSFFLWWCWPVVTVRRLRGWMRDDPIVMVLDITIGLLAVSFLFNAFVSPVVTVMLGCLVCLLQEATRPLPAQRVLSAQERHWQKVGGQKSLPLQHGRPLSHYCQL